METKVSREQKELVARISETFSRELERERERVRQTDRHYYINTGARHVLRALYETGMLMPSAHGAYEVWRQNGGNSVLSIDGIQLVPPRP